ncbi:S9 family peptidase [Virgibacillus sp. NKC19-3]|nr:S9 family peptidase [Virgibacillus sp. NKC19-3]
MLLKYLNVYGAYQPAVIPNQHAFTFLSKETGIPQVWKWNGKTFDIEPYTDLADRVLSVSHSPSGKKTMIGMDHNGNEKQQLYLLTNDGSTVEELVVSPEHFHEFGGWSPDETKITIASNRRDPGFFDIYVLDLKTKKMEEVYKHDGKCTPICWTKDEENILISVSETNIDNIVYVLHVESKELYRLGSKTISARHHSLELTNDGKGGFLSSDVGRDTMGVFKFSFDAPWNLQEMFGSTNWDIEEIALSPNEDMLAYTVNEGGFSSLMIYNLEKHSHYKVETLPTGVYQSPSWIKDGEIVIGVKSAVLPGDIWKFNLEEEKAERMTYVGESKDVEGLWMEPELHSFSSFDGLEVPYFYYGKQKQSCPVVVYVHGGPEHQIRAEYNPVIQFFAAQGFAVVAPNVRGSMGYGRKYVKLDDVRKRMDAVADLKWLVEDLVNTRGVDREKVGIMGRSYGGFMVLAALTHYPNIWAAGVDIVGISHFKTFLENTGPWRRALREYEYGSLKLDTDFFEEIAPLNHTNTITAPLLIFHGRNDTRVPVSEAIQLTDDLKNQNKPVELVIFEDEGHQTEKIENHIHMNRKIVEFMETFL